ncbi:aldo/keto reductase [Cytophagaceae bacterium ABcell3]|nr:aldo/keto reductase [Cytophagaceae bacterium ABcell3]
MSRIGLGTWAIGGWMWGGSDEKECVDTIVKAFQMGVNLIDTAPVYGFGRSEGIVGKSIAQINKREGLIVSTKCSLEWDDNGKVHRNASKERILSEVEHSLKRLQTDYVDILFVHWPDTLVPFHETAEAMYSLFKSGKIRSIGVSNYNNEQMDAFREVAPIHFSQPPYNLFEREIEQRHLPYCLENNIFLMTYGAICRGLLSGRMQEETVFEGDDLRKKDPKFQKPRYIQYLDAVKKLDEIAGNYNKSVIHLAARWILQQGVATALWGARKPQQLDVIKEISGWKITHEDMKLIDDIINKTVKDPVGPEFMAPPLRN